MSDRFDQLSLPPADEGLDPAVRARLLHDVRRLVAERSGAQAGDRTGATHPVEHVEVVMNESPNPPRWRTVAFVVAAVAAVAALVVVLVPRSGADDVESPAGEGGATSVSTAATTSTVVSSTTSTVPVAELTDEDLARAMVLTAAEYAPGWGSIGQNGNPVRLDGAKAATLAECAGFVDVMFEGPRRPATVLWDTMTYGVPIAEAVQYIVVFPDEAAAIAMFEGANDPRFISECMPAYMGPEVPCCEVVEFAPGMVGFVHEEGLFEHVGDQSKFRDLDFYWTNADGRRVGPETALHALIRVGRSVIGIEMVSVADGGVVIATREDFQNAVNNVVVRAEAALAGTPLPRG